jgi:hypothetical protein
MISNVQKTNPMILRLRQRSDYSTTLKRRERGKTKMYMRI